MFSNVWSENTALFERLMEIHSNSPKLYYGFNDEKTEVLHITSRFRSRLQLPTIKVDNSPIVPSDKVKNLGVIFDRHMVMDRFVSLKCKSASFQLHRLGKIRQYLDTTTAKKLVQALVLCHLDYCNSLLYFITCQTLS